MAGAKSAEISRPSVVVTVVTVVSVEKVDELPPAEGSIRCLVPKAGAADAEESEQKASAKTADRRANDESVLLSPPPPRHGTLGEGARGRGGQLRAGLGGRGRGEEGALTHRFGHHCQQPVL